MWSDTGSEIYDSKGDTIKVYNPDSYNFQSFSGPQVRVPKKTSDTTGKDSAFQ